MTGNTNNAATALDHAREWAERGFDVFPQSRTKRPLTTRGYRDATTDRDQIEEWAERYPNCNWAVATGQRSGIVVIDIDPRNGGNLNGLADKLPKTLTHATGGGGQHLICKYPPDRTVGKLTLAPGVELLG